MGNQLLELAAEQWIDAVIARILDQRPQAHEAICLASRKASEAYLLSNWNGLLRGAFKFFRKRRREADQTSLDLESFPDVFIRLQTLTKVFLNPKGKWEPTSYNTYLLIYLLGYLNGDEHPTQNHTYYTMLPLLVSLFKSKLQQAYQGMRYQRRKDLPSEKAESKTDKKSDDLDFILLADDSKKAKDLAMRESDKAVFLVRQSKSGIELFAYDLHGREIQLPLTEELQQSMRESLKSGGQLKSLCLKAREAHLLKGKFYLNPASAELGQIRSAFVLRQVELTRDKFNKALEDKGWISVSNLDWYDDKGCSHQIDLTLYPELEDFLNKNPHVAMPDALYLAHQLRRIDLDFKADLGQTKQILDALFQKNKEDPFSSFKALVNPKSTDLSGLASTFVVYINPRELRLDWYDTYGGLREIELTDYSDLTQWLSEHPKVSDNDRELKAFLIRVNTSKPINRDEFKEQLAACLKDGLARKQAESKLVTKDDSVVEPSAGAEERSVGKLDLNSPKYLWVTGLFGKPVQSVRAQKPVGKLDLNSSDYAPLFERFGKPVQPAKCPEKSTDLGEQGPQGAMP